MYFLECGCNTEGTIGNPETNCDQNGNCRCKVNVEGEKCNSCIPGYYNFPNCKGKYLTSNNMIFFHFENVWCLLWFHCNFLYCFKFNDVSC